MTGPAPRLVPVLGLVTLGACTAHVDVGLTAIAGSSGTSAPTGESSSSPTSTATGDTDDAQGPESCADILAAAPDAADGAYTLHAGGDLAQPWQAWCADMAGTPREYLILPMSGPGVETNYAEFLPGPQQPGTLVRTTYSRVRVDPHTLLVDISDQTFATSTGQLTFQGIEVTSMPYATAMGCVDPDLDRARGNVDLRGTPFKVWSSQWVPHGTSIFKGDAVASAEGQVVDLDASGDCGYLQPRLWDDAVPGPINNWGGFYLQLATIVASDPQGPR